GRRGDGSEGSAQRWGGGAAHEATSSEAQPSEAEPRGDASERSDSDVNVLFVASEVAPWAKTGGLADVAAALPKTLRKHGHDLRVFLPFYARVRSQAHDFQEGFPEHVVQLGRHTYRFALLRAPAHATYFVHCPPPYGRHAIYTADP